MAQLRQHYQKFVDRDTVVIVIGPEDAATFRAYWVKEQLPFIGLQDPHKSVLTRYGQEVAVIKLGRMPAQVVIDKLGFVRYVHYGHAMSDIPSNAEIIALLDEIDPKPTKLMHR
jgi:peroxiredoxin